MSRSLAKGVNLHVLPTEKYKTIRVMIRFATPLKKEIISKRTLLASLLETNSLHFPTQTDISEKLADLYGASFGINISKKGTSHYLTVVLNVVNDKYLPTEEKILIQAIEFLKEILFYPNITNQLFDEETFQIEKSNLKEYIASIYEDKQSHAALALQTLYFDEIAQQIPSFGLVEDVEKETSKSMAMCYQEMIQKDEVDIFVIGDVNENQMYPIFQQFMFEDREIFEKQKRYVQTKSSDIKEQVETLPVIQGKLNMAFYTGIYFHDPLYFPLQVFNGLFGGFAHSKLFMNVREKESMAYYASSSLDTFRGYLTVQSGIETKNKERVLFLVKEQLSSIQKGEITEDELYQTKEMLKNQYLLSLDNAGAVIESAYVKEKFPEGDLSTKEWIESIEKVTKLEVQEVAKEVELQAIYFMEGGQG